MKDPKIKTRVVHSQSKPAWNVVSVTLGAKYKIARVPYIVSESMEAMDAAREEAYNHAVFISYCFNNSSRIILCV